jgi:hypothetical protein
MLGKSEVPWNSPRAADSGCRIGVCADLQAYGGEYAVGAVNIARPFPSPEVQKVRSFQDPVKTNSIVTAHVAPASPIPSVTDESAPSLSPDRPLLGMLMFRTGVCKVIVSGPPR